MSAPRICFGQQPCGFFPRRFLAAKIFTARRLQQQLGGEILFFYHDSDHDPRETNTILRHSGTGNALQMNFAFENKLQKKFSPLYLKRIPAGWQTDTARRLPACVDAHWVEAFKNVQAATVADFCLEMYRAMGLLEGIRVIRSSDPAVRLAACDIDDFFVDVPYQGETVRARMLNGQLQLHQGGDSYLCLPPTDFTKKQISPARDTRLRWMQSVLHCTHYVSGAGEQQYMNLTDAPDVTFIQRDPIERSDEAYTDI